MSSPRLTAALAGTGGALKTSPEDFVVEEVPAYPPSGAGGHTFLFIEKRGITTEEALARIARATGAPRAALGAAGMKDRHAVTRQWISVPDLDPEAARVLPVADVRVLAAERHGHKLRTGHLRGNRFRVVLRGLACAPDDALARARAVLAALAATGLPNRFGPQRFGARGDNAERGRALLTGGERRRLDRGERRLLVSAFQSDLFNRCLDARLADDLLREPLAGDVLRKRESGGLFTVAEGELGEARARLSAGELDVTGPMFGHKMKAPPPGSPAAAREDAVWAAGGVPPAALAEMGAIAEGTRRPFTVPIGEPEAAIGEGGEADALVIAFSLPSGAYATVLIDEIAKV